jgi:serine/threonine protein kinase
MMMSRAEGPTSAVLPHQPSGRAVRASRPVTSNNEEPQVPLLLINRYRVSNMIGSGSFGHIFEADDIHTHEQVAVKFESQSLQYPQLAYEARVLKLITGIGIPKVFWLVRVTERVDRQGLLVPQGMAKSRNTTS